MANRKARRKKAPEVAKPPDQFETVAKIARENMLWVLGLTPFVVAGISLLVTAQGDLATLAELVRYIPPSQLFFGAAAATLPAALLIIPLLMQERAYYGDPNPRHRFLIVLAIYGLGFFALPNQVFSGLLIGNGLMFAFVLLESKFFKSEGRVRVFSGLTLVCAAVGVWLGSNSWLALQVVSIGEQSPSFVTAYLLGEQGDFTKLLEVDGGVRAVKSDEIQSLQTCYQGRVKPESMYQRLLGSKKTNPECSELIAKQAKKKTPG